MCDSFEEPGGKLGRKDGSDKRGRAGDRGEERRGEMVHGLMRILHPKERAVLQWEGASVWRRWKGKGSGGMKCICSHALLRCNYTELFTQIFTDATHNKKRGKPVGRKSNSSEMRETRVWFDSNAAPTVKDLRVKQRVRV